MRGPLSVIATVCSKCADSEPSCVTTVHLSSSVRIAEPPMLIIGSIAIVKPKRGPRLAPGMTIAIEPMINIGGSAIRTLDDKWTVVTQDGSLSAHFEHTVAITDNGPRILTRA